jgi:tetratricopeptide (TPR) repeat protein
MNTPPSRGRRVALQSASWVIAAVALGVFAIPAPALAADCPLPKEVFEVVNSAKSLLSANKGTEVLAKVREAEGMKDLPACAKPLLTQLRVAGAMRSGSAAEAAKALQAAGSEIPSAQAVQYDYAVAQMYFAEKNNAEAINWANKYTQAGGDASKAKQMQMAIYQATGDWQSLQKMALDLVNETERAGGVPSENDLNMVLFTADKLKDSGRYSAFLEKMVIYHPSQEAWSRLITDVQKRPNFARRMELDIMRLMFATGNLKPEKYEEYVGLTIQANNPGEAKLVLDKGFEAKVLGTDPQKKERETRLRAMVTTKIDDTQKNQYFAELSAKRAATGEEDVAIGMEYYGLQKYDQAITWLNEGITKGGLKNPGDAKLHLAIVYLAAGQKQKALDLLKTVKDTDGSGDIARLWTIKAGGRPS